MSVEFLRVAKKVNGGARDTQSNADGHTQSDDIDNVFCSPKNTRIYIQKLGMMRLKWIN
jgi:hypothetical protein